MLIFLMGLFSWWKGFKQTNGKCDGEKSNSYELNVSQSNNLTEVDSHAVFHLKAQLETLQREKLELEAKRDAAVQKEKIEKCRCSFYRRQRKRADKFRELLFAMEREMSTFTELQRQSQEHWALCTLVGEAKKYLKFPENVGLQQRDEVVEIFERLNRQLELPELELEKFVGKLRLKQQIDIVKRVDVGLRLESSVLRNRVLELFKDLDDQIECAQYELNQLVEGHVLTDLKVCLENARTKLSIVVVYLDPNKSVLNQAFIAPNWPFGIVP